MKYLKHNINVKIYFLDFPVCIPCRRVYELYKIKDERENQVLSSGHHPLVAASVMLDELEQCIIQTTPKYEDILTIIRSQTYPEQAGSIPEIIQVYIFIKTKKNFQGILIIFHLILGCFTI